MVVVPLAFDPIPVEAPEGFVWRQSSPHRVELVRSDEKLVAIAKWGGVHGWDAYGWWPGLGLGGYLTGWWDGVDLSCTDFDRALGQCAAHALEHWRPATND